MTDSECTCDDDFDADCPALTRELGKIRECQSGDGHKWVHRASEENSFFPGDWWQCSYCGCGTEHVQE